MFGVLLMAGQPTVYFLTLSYSKPDRIGSTGDRIPEIFN
jgi:hypothetical protein